MACFCRSEISLESHNFGSKICNMHFPFSFLFFMGGGGGGNFHFFSRFNSVIP